MQDRYVGDVGDYGKYALLNMLSKTFRLGVIWYLVDDESHTNDGKFTQYPKLAHLDPKLYSQLQEIIKRKRSVKAVEKKKVLPGNTIYFSEKVSQNFRGQWFDRALEKTKKCQLVFFDPDNGLEPKSIKPHHRKGPKFAYLSEVKKVFEKDRSLVIYHHLGRVGSTDQQIAAKTKEIRQAIVGSEVTVARYGRGTARAFFILSQKKHLKQINEVIAILRNSEWVRGKHFFIY